MGISKQGIPSGLGMFRYTDGKYDAGYYYKGSLTGLGRLSMNNGDIYDGFLKDGKLKGKGLFYENSSQQWVFGYFEENKCLNLVKKGAGEYPVELIGTASPAHPILPPAGPCLGIQRRSQALSTQLSSTQLSRSGAARASHSGSNHWCCLNFFAFLLVAGCLSSVPVVGACGCGRAGWIRGFPVPVPHEEP